MNLTQVIIRKLPSTRNNFLYHETVTKTLACHKSTKDPSPSSSSSSSSSSDNDEKIKRKTSSNDAVTRLNSLLQQMVSKDATQAKNTINLAKPLNQRLKGRQEKELVTKQSVEKKIVDAVKDVAENLGGNTKQTESELLMKLLNPVENHEENRLSDILKGMKIERDPKPQQSRAEQVRSALKKVSSRPQVSARSSERGAEKRKQKHSRVPIMDQSAPQYVDLFGGETLGVFTNVSELKDSPQLCTWKKLHEKELNLAVTHPPANYFQQMILWTEQGKFWQFPIDNEFGLEEEKKVYFADHIFLEEHLEPWCPKKGPIRHFMELVCVGLSKNSYLTVEAKKEHIEWYKNYFEDKKKLLQDVGALEGGPKKSKSEQKSISEK